MSPYLCSETDQIITLWSITRRHRDMITCFTKRTCTPVVHGHHLFLVVFATLPFHQHHCKHQSHRLTHWMQSSRCSMYDYRWNQCLQTFRIWWVVRFACDRTIPKQNIPKTPLPDPPMWLQTRACATLCVLFNVQHTYTSASRSSGVITPPASLMEAVIYIMEGLSETWYLGGRRTNDIMP